MYRARLRTEQIAATLEHYRFPPDTPVLRITYTEDEASIFIRDGGRVLILNVPAAIRRAAPPEDQNRRIRRRLTRLG